MGLFDIFKTKNALPEDVKKDTKNPERYLDEQQKYRQFEDLKTFEDAITEAENLHNPQRYGLNRIYDEIEKDPHFISQWESRKMKTIQRGFGLYSGDSEEKDPATELLESDWFHKVMHYILDSKKRGFEFIIFGDWVNDKFKWSKDAKGFLYPPVLNINYDHIIPEKGLIKKSNYDFTGLDIFKPPISNKSLFVGDPKSFGILEKCAKYILIKNNCLLNWSEFAEVFGHDLRIGKTQAQGKDRTAFFEMLKKLGAGGFGVMDEDDEIVFAGTSRTDAYQVYKELNEYVDKNISKIVFGQDVLSDMTGVTRGTAAENIADLYGDHDSKFIKGIINNELIPKLISMGLPLEGKTFEWDTQEGLTLTEQSDIDLKISQMGKNIDDEYLTEKYGTVLGDAPEQKIQNPEQVAKQLKNLYGKRDS